MSHDAVAPEQYDRLLVTFAVLAFLGLNAAILPGGEYQPALYLLVGLALLLKKAVLELKLFYVLIAFFVVALCSGITNNYIDAAAWLKLVTVVILLITGERLLVIFTPAALKVICILHLLLFCAWAISPAISSSIMVLINPRGLTYYFGFNSYFASEPSYAALNIFGVYLLTKINVYVKNGSTARSRWEFLVPAVLMSTLSLTGFLMGMLTLVFITRNSQRKTPMALKLIVGAILLYAPVLAAEYSQRFSTFFYFIGEVDFENFLYTWAAIEPSSSTRFIANIAAFYEGMTGIVGRGTFALAGPGQLDYPQWLGDVFRINGILDEGSFAQTPLANMVLFLGIPGLVLMVVLTWRAVARLRVLERRLAMLTFAFIFICTLWQAAFTYPFYWIVLCAPGWAHSTRPKRWLTRNLTAQASSFSIKPHP